MRAAFFLPLAGLLGTASSLALPRHVNTYPISARGESADVLKRDVFVPVILEPRAGDTWTIGQMYTVRW